MSSDDVDTLPKAVLALLYGCPTLVTDLGR